MSYVESITGDPINPVPFDYKSLSITANTTYAWSDLAKWNDITASSTYTITMPPANQVGLDEIVFFNYGSNTVTINDNSGNSITTVASGIIKRLWITNNSTVAGTWRSSNIGTGTTTADASALAGYGMKAISGKLSQDTPPNLYNTNQTLDATHRAGVQIWTGGAGNFDLTNPTTLTSGWFCMVRNSGTGILTLTPLTGNIDGGSTVSMATGEGFTICTDGSNFYTLGRVSAATTGKTLLNKSVAGSSDVTLTAVEESYDIIKLTGILTGNINVKTSTTVREWIFDNATTGSYTLTIKTTSGTGVQIPQGSKMIFYSDGTNIVSTDYPPYYDTTIMIKGSVDSTKQFRFEADGLTTATTRVYTVPDADTTLVGTDATQTLTNKSLQDSSTNFIDNADATKVFKFQLASITTATTRTGTIPDGDFTFVGVDLQQTLTNKKLSDSTFQIVDNGDNTKQVEFQISGITTATKRTFTFPDYDATFATQAGTETLTNKSLQDSTTYLIDNADATKKAQFELSGIDTATTRTITLPNKSGTMAMTSDIIADLVNGWARFQATTLLAGSGITSISSGSTGNYTVTLPAKASANYAKFVLGGGSSDTVCWATDFSTAGAFTAPTTTSFIFSCKDAGNTARDYDFASILVVGG